MHIGHVLMASANVLGPWFGRGGDNAVFTWEEVQASNSASLTVTVWHKNSEDIGPGTEISPTWTTDGKIRYSDPVGPLKEMVRFEYTVSGVPVSGTVTTPDEPLPSSNPLDNGNVGWVIYRMLEPTWFDKADAS